MVTTMFEGNCVCRKCEGNVGEAVVPEGLLFNEVKLVREFSYLGLMVSSCGIYEAAVTAKILFGWLRFMECGELHYGNGLHLSLKGIVSKVI